MLTLTNLPTYRAEDVTWDREALGLFTTLPEMTLDNRISAALMRDALPTLPERAAKRTVTLARFRAQGTI